jgi:serine protease Do
VPYLIARQTLGTLLLVGLLSSFSPGASRAPSPEVVAQVKHAVVLITSYDGNGRADKQGSGFFLTPQRVVTNLHVVDAASKIRINTFSGSEMFVDSVVASDKADDLAILQLEAPCSDAVILGLEAGEPAAGDSVIVVSNPLGAHWQVTLGEVGTMWHFLGMGERMQITAGLLPGSSGGPVLNLQGRVIGIAAMHFRSEDNLNFAILAGRLEVLRTNASRSATSAAFHRD